MNTLVDQLRLNVQHNCDITDAHYAQRYTLCVYLLKMREFYRWSQNLGYTESINKEKLGNWVMEKETQWEQLEEAEFIPIHLNGIDYDPWDLEGINSILEKHHLIYGAGIGNQGREHFFLAAKVEIQKVNELTIYRCGNEYARDLTSPPAVLQGKNILLREESLRRILWERIEDWQFNGAKPCQALGKIINPEDPLEHTLDQLVEHETQLVIQHEQGEAKASELLGDEWNDMIYALKGTQAELRARALRDILADATFTLPWVVEKPDKKIIHLYFSTFKGIRKEMMPSWWNNYLNDEINKVDFKSNVQLILKCASQVSKCWNKHKDHKLINEILSEFKV
ncbi:MAG: Sfum_1244 family protein [bacterium]